MTTDKNDRFKNSRNFLATDKVPDTIFGIPVAKAEGEWTEEDLAFFREHPEAGGYYSMGDEETPEDGSPEGAPVQADMPVSGDRDRYDTKLTKREMAEYQAWRATIPVALQYEGDYDLRGYWKDPDTVKTAVTGDHFTDKYKKPNHPTFSTESIYATGDDRQYAGTWDDKKMYVKPAAREYRDFTNHVKKSESFHSTVYKDSDGKYKIGYGSILLADGTPVTSKTKPITKEQADQAFTKDLERRIERLATRIPGWSSMSRSSRYMLLDASWGRNDALSQDRSPGLNNDLTAAGKDRAKLDAAVRKHYPSYRKAYKADGVTEVPEMREGLQNRRIALIKAMLGEDFSYEGKVWDDEKGFVEETK